MEHTVEAENAIPVATPAPFRRCKVITYASDHNTAVEKQICLQHLAGNLYRGKTSHEKYGQTYCRIYLYFKELGVGMDVGGMVHPDLKNAEAFFAYAPKTRLQSPQEFIETLDEAVASGGRITNADIALAQYIAPNNVESYIDMRRRYFESKNAERVRHLEKCATDDSKYCEERNAQAAQQMNDAIQTILAGGEVKNDTITLFKSKCSYSSYQLINHLARAYNVEVPLKVQGWINKSLASVTISNGQVTKYRYKGGRSQTFGHYMSLVVTAILQDKKLEKVG